MQGIGVVASAAFSTDANPPDAVRALQLIAATIEHRLHPHSTLA